MVEVASKEKLIYAEDNDKIAIINGEEKITYKQLKQKISLFANTMKDIEKQSRCFIFSEPRVGYIYALYAIYLRECTYTTWFHNLDVASLISVLNEIKPVKIFVSKKQLPKLKEAIELTTLVSSQIIIIDDLENESIESFDAVEIEVTTSNVANIVYTAGITEHHRPTILTYKNYIWTIKSIVNSDFYIKENTVLNILPYYNTWILLATVIIPLYNGWNIVFPLSNTIDDVINAIEKNKVLTIIGVNNLYKDILEYLLPYTIFTKRINQLKYKLASIFKNIKISAWLFPDMSKLKSVHFFLTIGAHINDIYTETFLNLGFDVFEGYGMAEGSSIVTIPISKKIDRQAVGRFIDGIEFKIIDDEIVLRGPNITINYFNRPEKNKEVFHNGWFFTKDIGYIKDGLVYIDTTRTDLIKTIDGHTVVPRELEDNFLQFLDKIKEIGIYYDENIFKASIIPTSELKEKYPTEKELIDFLRWNIVEPVNYTNEKYKRIDKIFITESPFLRSTSGKLKRYLLKDREPNAEVISVDY